MIMARLFQSEVTQGTLEGHQPGSITFYRLQARQTTEAEAYIAQGEGCWLPHVPWFHRRVRHSGDGKVHYRHVPSRRTIRTTGLLPSETTARHFEVFKVHWRIMEEIATTSQRVDIRQRIHLHKMQGGKDMLYIGVDLEPQRKIVVNGWKRTNPQGGFMEYPCISPSCMVGAEPGGLVYGLHGRHEGADLGV